MKNVTSVHENRQFHGRGSGYLLYWHDVFERDLSTTLEMTVE